MLFRYRAPLFAGLIISWLALSARRAEACGVSASGVSSCSLADHDEAERPHWAVGVSGLYTTTRLHFSGGLYADQIRYATLASLAYLPTPRLVLQFGAGVAFGGSLTVPETVELANGASAGVRRRYDFSAGPTMAIGADYRAFDDGLYFMLLTSNLSFVAAQTHSDGITADYEALDLRLGTELGLQLAHIFRPYAALRVFGGPVYWRHLGESVTGTDTHHYQVGAGVGVRVTKTLNLFAEGIPLGERAVSIGVGLAL
jgi:hypothetical protein